MIEVNTGSCRSESWLKQTPLLRDLPEHLIQYVARHATVRQLRDKECLFLQNDPSHFIGIIADGDIHHVLSNSDGHELIIGHSASNQVIGIPALLSQTPRYETARASGMTRVLLLSHEHFRPLLKEQTFHERLLTVLKIQLEAYVAFIETMCLYSLEVRLARHVLANLQQSDAPIPHVRLPAHQGLLASMINASRPKLNGYLQKWKRQGVVRIHRNHLLIDDLAQIRRTAQLPALSPPAS
ncbi:transcriptional regulator [Betaproteobacteria bacterium]|nr:transcriptional regulator [Betaproteobacteria bacterium]